jgi:diguanylate cyclase (GGDEF)-like protein/PAS domain S-box-containing protein
LPAELGSESVTRPTEDVGIRSVLELATRLADGELDARGRPTGSGRAVDAIIVRLNSLAETFQSTYRQLSQEKLALERSEERFRALVQNASDAVLVLGMDGLIAYASPSMGRLIGYDPGELAGRDGATLVYPDDLPLTLECFAHLQEPGSSALGAYRVQHRDGSVLHVETVFTNLLHDPAINGFVLNSRDVTERQRAEEALKRSQQQLAEAQAIAQVGSWEWDIASDTVVWSEELYRMAGLLPGEFQQTYETFLETVHPDDRELVHRVVRKALETGTSFEYDARIVRPSGELRFQHARGRVLRAPDGNIVGLFGIGQDITERKLLEERIRFRALHDPLTGLANRTLFLDRVEHALARRRGPEDLLAIFFLDLDNFKTVNDSLGHAAGDSLLNQVGDRLKQSLREVDTAARLGGDEFGVLIDDIERQDDSIAIARRILHELQAPFEVDEREIHIGASVGIAVAMTGTDDSGALLRNADIAMYAAKRDSKGAYAVFDPRMHTAVLERLELEADLRRAIDRGELVLYYQPVVDLDSLRIVGAEALIRWAHPRRGQLAPLVFIPIAEESGLIAEVGHWVLQEACRQAAEWAGTGLTYEVAVNVSARQLQDASLVGFVASALETSGLPPADLTLEITETVLMHETTANLETITALKALGVRIAIDDFGTGYSSLGYLHQFPVDTVKIDRSFIKDAGSEGEGTAVAQAIVSLAESFRLRTIAEGVENAEQAQVLRVLGCQMAQGYYFSRPVCQEDFLALLHPHIPSAGAFTK